MIKRISKFGLVHQSYSIQAAMRIQVYNIISLSSSLSFHIRLSIESPFWLQRETTELKNYGGTEYRSRGEGDKFP